MQPLGHTFFKPLKVDYNTGENNWMLSNQERRISFFDMGGIFATAYNFTANIDKAINGFRCSGLYPINELIFNDEAFDAALLNNDAEPLEICQQSNELPNLPFVAPIQLPNEHNNCCKIEGCCYNQLMQFCQLLMSILDLNLPQKVWKRFSCVPKFLY